tara:strand:+ start:211 stop:993 length:783 start_codon:yes stop_codon:yes gene_type:complete
MYLKNIINETIEYRFFLNEQVGHLVLLRYRRTVLGYLWNLLSPLMTMSITTFVFATIYRTDIPDFTIYLFSGMLVFSFFRDSLSISSNVFLQNENLIKKVYVPRFLFPLSRVIFAGIDNISLFTALSLIIFFLGGKFSIALIMIPIFYIILFLFCLGFGLIFSVLSVYFRDLPYLINIGLQGLLFLSPVFIKPTIFPSKLNYLLKLNPITYYIDLFRYPLYKGTFPPTTSVLISTFMSVFCIIIGFKFFYKYKDTIPMKL